MGNKAHWDLLVTDLLKSFAEAYADLKPIAMPGTQARLSDVLHKLRDRSLNLMHEARDA